MADTSLIKPIQPYFVFMSYRFFQEIYLKQGISHFYSFTGSDVPHPVTVVPDGCVDIIFEYDAGAIQAYVTVRCLHPEQRFSARIRSISESDSCWAGSR